MNSHGYSRAGHPGESQKRPGSRSFTLVELLVAVSVLSLLMIVLFQIFNESTRAWGAAEHKVDAYREARAALFFMARDLQNAVVTNGAALAINQDQIHSSFGDPTTGKEPSIFFVSTQPPEAQDNGLSALCTVGYYTAFGGEAGNSFTYKIRRYFRSSNDTFNNLMKVVPPKPMKVDLLFEGVNNALNGDEILARNVGNLQISWANNTGDSFSALPVIFTNSPPLQIQVSLDALNADTAARLGTQARWKDTNELTNPAYFKNVQHFTTRVTLRQIP